MVRGEQMREETKMRRPKSGLWLEETKMRVMVGRDQNEG